MDNEYGTSEYYAELFGDILADVGTGSPEQDRTAAINIMEGFELALIEWMKYHEDAAKSYRELHGRFLLCKDPTDK
jgi:hypothetical protein